VSVCWINGRIVGKEKATVSVFDHGLLYGDGVFEGIRFYNSSPFRLVSHIDRLNRSAKAIGLKIRYSPEELKQAVYDVINKFKKPDGYLRVVITRGEGPLGINPDLCKKSTVFIIADQTGFIAPHIKNNGAKLIIASTRRLPPDGLDSRVKSLNYLNHILARIEANHAIADEAILLNAQGHVTEGTTDNIFIVKDNEILTPPVTDGALQGITRDIIFELVKGFDVELNIKCNEKTLSPYDLYTADECFLTGTAVELIPVSMIDGREISSCPGEVFKHLQAAFKDKIQIESVFTSNKLNKSIVL